MLLLKLVCAACSSVSCAGVNPCANQPSTLGKPEPGLQASVRTAAASQDTCSEYPRDVGDEKIGADGVPRRYTWRLFALVGLARCYQDITQPKSCVGLQYHSAAICHDPFIRAGEESLAGSRRQSKVKYIYRLLRQGDVAESLEGKTVRGGLGGTPAPPAPLFGLLWCNPWRGQLIPRLFHSDPSTNLRCGQ
jgi:hypothetical protein